MLSRDGIRCWIYFLMDSITRDWCRINDDIVHVHIRIDLAVLGPSDTEISAGKTARRAGVLGVSGQDGLTVHAQRDDASAI